VANSHGDRADEGRRSDRRHSANFLWERDDSCISVGASIVIACVRVGVCQSGCVSRAAGVESSVIDCTAGNSKKQQERRSVGAAAH